MNRSLLAIPSGPDYNTITQPGTSTQPGTTTPAQPSNSSDFEIKDGVLTKYKGSGGDVVIPNDVTRIGDSVFYRCAGLTSVTIENGITNIGRGTFSGCTSLTNVTIPSSVTSIGESAFYNTPWLKDQGGFAVANKILLAYQGSGGDVTIPEGVTSIGGGHLRAAPALLI